MIKRVLAVLMVFVSTVGCSVRKASEPIMESLTSRSGYRSVQIVQDQVLPPYGVTVTAKAAVLELSLHTSQEESVAMQKELQDAVDHIGQLAAENGQIALDRVRLGQIGGTNEYVRESASYTTQNLDATTIIVRLTMPIEVEDRGLGRCLNAFNAFIQTIALPETTTVQVMSVRTEMGDLEAYRSQIIERVYAELDAVQAQYGETVKYEISGLYGRLNVMPLNDVENYVYLEPVVLVKEF